MTSYFQMVVENTVAVTLWNWEGGGETYIVRKTMSPFLALSFITVLLDSSSLTLPSFRSKKKRKKKRKQFFECGIHSNEKTLFFFLHQEALLRG